jgi:hypothetical protein
VFNDIEVTEHDGFDRIVLEFSGSGRPGWVVDYVDKAQLDGSGEVVELGGDLVLAINACNTTWPAPGYYAGPARLAGAGDLVDEVYVGGSFEGCTQVFAGIRVPLAPVRVAARRHPSRLVIDVVESGD